MEKTKKTYITPTIYIEELVENNCILVVSDNKSTSAAGDTGKDIDTPGYGGDSSTDTTKIDMQSLFDLYDR